MNEKARAELVRQLVSGCKFFVVCTKCHQHWRGTHDIDSCPLCSEPVEEDPVAARNYYNDLVDGAIAWGEKP